jgi:low temperature requirement protein LtrA
VTTLLADDPTAGGLARGFLVLGALWWAWAAYAWLTNTLDPEEGAVRIAMLASVAAMLICALAVPEAFDDHGVLFGVAYLVVRALHIALYALAARGDPGLARAVLSITPTSTTSGLLLIAAGFLDGRDRIVLWVGALAIDYGGALLTRGGGWHLHPHHFAERHALIVIIAIGESIVALGVGAAGIPLDAGVVVAALLGITIAASLWWTYFDWFTIIAEHRLAEMPHGAARSALARDIYSSLHLLIVGGIVVAAMALKKTLGDVHEPLKEIPALALCGGLALYLLAYSAMRLRLDGEISRGRLVAAVALLALYPLVVAVPAYGAIALAVATLVVLIVYEALRYRAPRAEIRALRARA